MDNKTLYELSLKHIDDLNIHELENIRFILECLPKGIDYVINSEVDDIDDYIDKRYEDFFDASEEDYKRNIGKCFINNDKTVVIKVVGLRDDYDNKYYVSERYIDNFLYEKYEKYIDDTWHVQDYIWLQDTANRDEKYKRWCLTPYTEMNINSEEMFKLGKDGNFYESDNYDVYKPMSEATFELIRKEAIDNDK